MSANFSISHSPSSASPLDLEPSAPAPSDSLPFPKQTLRDVDVSGKTVLVRTDFNVPLALDPETNQPYVVSDLRIRASLPTINYLRDHHAAKIILISHLGRPKGQVDPGLSLRPVAESLAGLLPGVPVEFVDQLFGPDVESAVESLPEGGILLLENLRFHPGETANLSDFAEQIVASTSADLFVQDGFAITHRAHASTAAITKLLPSVAGLLLEREVLTLTSVLHDPAHPFVVIIGGAKVTDKQPLIDRLLSVADHILVGGKIAADGYVSPDPKVYVAEDFDEDSTGAKLDIGPLSTAHFASVLESARVVLWNGTLGKTEDAAYATASTIIAGLIGQSPNLTSIICGGDTTAFIEELTAEHPEFHFDLVSTGGGAALALLSGQKLPGLETLNDA